MLRCSIAVVCSLWVTYSFGQSSPTSISAGSTAEIVCKSESEEVVLHATASATLPVAEILSCGAHVTVVAEQTGWYRIRAQDGKEGYVKDVFLAATSPVEQATSHIKDGYINCSSDAAGVHLYESVEGLRAIMLVHCGEKIAVLEEIQRETGNWDKIETSGGSVGYLWSGFVSANPPPPTAQAQYAAPYARQSSPAEKSGAEVSYAIEVTSDIRNSMLDPTSFTILQVIAIHWQRKNGTVEFRGCVHYVGSNVVGGRLQGWGIYEVSKKGRVSVVPQSIWGECYGFGERTDVTTEVKKGISQGDGR
jgi:SH3-like domain-containing protein